jgi:peptidyl-prolyl cis-trans isomerase A (cyclophilin A)
VRVNVLAVGSILSLVACASCDAGGEGPLYNPSMATETAPEVFHVKLETTEGEIVIACNRAWAPNGADRIYNLVKMGYFDDVAMFRVVKEPVPFVAQFGIHGNPAIAKRWVDATIPADAPAKSNARGTVSFAMAGKPDTRTTQLFFNLANNARLDGMGFAPVCEVIGDGMKVLEAIHGGYGEQPDQGRIQSKGNAYLKEKFPELDYVVKASLTDG